jgi:hypothetical protein
LMQLLNFVCSQTQSKKGSDPFDDDRADQRQGPQFALDGRKNHRGGRQSKYAIHHHPEIPCVVTKHPCRRRPPGEKTIHDIFNIAVRKTQFSMACNHRKYRSLCTERNVLQNSDFLQSVKLWKLPTESSILRSGLSLAVLESSSKAAIAMWDVGTLISRLSSTALNYRLIT